MKKLAALGAICLVTVGSPLQTRSQSPTSAAANLEIKYDKFQNQTSVGTKWLSVNDPMLNHQRLEKMEFKALYVCDGEKESCYSQASRVLLMFFARTSNWTFMDSHDLVFIADGKRIRAPKTTWDGRRNDADDLSEFVSCLVPLADALKLANSETVEGELGYVTFYLGGANQAGLRALARKLQKR
jgi:hypothetical protein